MQPYNHKAQCAPGNQEIDIKSWGVTVNNSKDVLLQYVECLLFPLFYSI